MFKRSNKQNIRRRRDTEEDNSDDDKTVESNAVSKPVSIKIQTVSSKKEKKKESKQASLLSFDDGEEEDVAELKLKKSSRSRRIAKEIKKRSQLEKEALNNPTAIGTNGNTNQANSNKNIHVFKPMKPKQESSVSPPVSSKKESIPNFNSGMIPTPSMIHAARKQREMLRKFGSEYISAEDTQKYKENTQSRLIRDDDDDGSSDEGIMEMKGIEKKNENAGKKFVPNESDDEDDKKEDDNADEEVNRWEEEMIKKGINAQTNQSASNIPPPIPPPTFFNSFGDYYNNAEQQSNLYVYPQTEAKSDITFDVIKKRLGDHLCGLKLRNESNVNEMDKLDADTTECEDMSKHLGDVKSISSEYQFYQEMRQYVKDLVGCLRENVKVINSLEDQAHALWKNQAKRIISRRRQDIQDESIQIASTNKGVQDKNPNSNSDFVARVREREARRTRRRAARQIKHASTPHYDGLSSDDEETTMHQAQFNTGVQRIESSCATLFDDVLDDFCVLKNILQRFDSWREQHNDSYNDAYIALCIPKILFPFIRQKMILWNPLLSSTPHFEEEKWYKDLSMFGLKLFPLDGQEDSGNVLDDAKILSSVVEKVLSVKLLFFIQHVWDPMSTQQTIRLCLIFKELNRSYPFMTADHHQCQRLFQSVCKRLQSAVDNDIFIPLLPSSSDDGPAHAFLERQTWACIKLFKNAMLLDGILSYKILCEVAIESVLNRYILLALQISVLNVSCLDKCMEIVNSIPKRWKDKHDDLQEHLSSLARFLVHFAQSIKASQQIATKTMLKQIKSKLLVIGAKDALLQI